MSLLALDTETHLIGKGQVTPPIICAQFASLEEGQPFAWIVEKANPSFKSDIIEALSDESLTLIFHNAAFDLTVIAKAFPETMPLIWKALDGERVRDTMIREMLYNLTATGDIDSVELNGVVDRADYSLGGMAKKYLGVDRSADKDGEGAVRMNYEMVENQPLSEWPDEFVTYAENDAKDTLLIFLEQSKAGKELQERIGYDPYVTEAFRIRAHFALQLMTEHGNLLDGEKVLEVAKEFDELYNDPKLVKPLVLSYFIEEYAKSNESPITERLITEALEAFDGMDAKQQAKWVGTGIVIPAVPPEPYATGQKEHELGCIYHPDNPGYVGKTGKDCSCPVKMKGAKAECGSDKALHRYMWNAAKRTDVIELWAADSLKKKLKEEGVFDDLILDGRIINTEAVSTLLESPEGLPEKWLLCADEEWLATFAKLDPILDRYYTRKEYAKIITSYIPGLFWAEGMLNCPSILEGHTDRLAGKVPADVVHSCFRPLKRTGRTSSYANKKGLGKNALYMYPSMNGQQVDPRIRPCIIPRPGYKLFSIDYSAMELGTAAQKCVELFGFSVLGDTINAGRDVHSYLGMYIAQELDPWFADIVTGLEPLKMYEFFMELKSSHDKNASPTFDQTWKDMGREGTPTFADFYAHFRKFAKPTGLGYPGGLGPETFVAYAKATYGVSVDLETAYKLRDIWKTAFPEMALYLDYVSKRCFDPNFGAEIKEDEDGKSYKKQYYSYDTPLGMHRAKTDFCACANGMALQSPSAEGALLAASEIQREIRSGVESILADVDGVAMVRPTIFIHDELFGEIRDDELLTARIERMREIMKSCMECITPNVRAGTEACIMNRWSKKAFPYYVDGKLRPYEEAPKKEDK